VFIYTSPFPKVFAYDWLTVWRGSRFIVFDMFGNERDG
jgi:hypothetical protein